MAIGLGGGAAVAAPAQANIGTGPASSLKDAFSRSPADLTKALLCPTTTVLADATRTFPGLGVGAVTNQISNIVCALNILGYAYRTTYIPASGPPVVKYFRATALLPSNMDVDGDGGTDFIGMLTPSLGLSGATLSISRYGTVGTGRASVEAVLLNPAAPDSYIGIGEDGTTAGTAINWSATMGFSTIVGSNVALEAHVNVNQPGPTLGLIGEGFSGADADAPTSVSRAVLSMTPQPPALGMTFYLNETRQEVIADTGGVASKAVADVDVIRPGTKREIDVTVDKLPSRIDVVHQTTSGHENTTYTANAAIDKVNATYRERQGSSIVTAAALDATGVPAQIAVDQVDGKTSVGATNGAFGSVEARFAKGGDVPAVGAGTGPYVAFHRYTGTKLEGGLRLTNLKSVAFDAAGPYSGRLIFSQQLPSVPLSAKDDVNGISATGSLTGLPLDTEVTADMPNGVVAFDGHGQGITQIALSARKNSGVFFTKASRLDATIDNLPAANTFNIKQVNGQVSAAATNPIGSISVLASDGSDAPSVTGPAAWYEDTAARYRGFVRIDKLKGLSFSGSPFSGTVETGAPQVLKLHGEVGTLKLDGAIDKLPSKITFSMADTAGGGKVIDYDSYGQIVDLITLEGDGVPSPVGGGGFLRARVERLPGHLTATVPANGGKIVFDTHGTYVGRVFAKLWGNEDPGDTVAGRQSLSYSENGQWIVADIHNIGHFEIIPGSAPLFLQYDISSEPLDIGVDKDHKYVSATISNPQPATLSMDASLGVLASYNVTPSGPNFRGDGSIDSIDIRSNAGGGYLEASLQHIPARLIFCLQDFSGTLCKPAWVPLSVRADGDSFTVPATDFAFRLLPRDLNNQVPAQRMELDGVICTDEQDPTTCKDDGQRKARIEISDLRFNTVEAGFGHTSDDCTGSECGRVYAGFNTDDTHINGRVAQYPDGEEHPDIELRAREDNKYIAANQKFFFAHYDVGISADWLDTFSSGTLSCGPGEPELEYEIPGPNPDLLSGTFGICP